MQMFILYETASGYCLFEKEEYDETGGSLSKVQKAVNSLERFTKMVTIAAYQPFKTAEEALENIQAIAANQVSSTLKHFLSTHLPSTKSSKKQKFALGICDPHLGQAIFSETGITASYNETVVELLRGIRMHFAKIIKSNSSIVNTPLIRGQRVRHHARPARSGPLLLALQVRLGRQPSGQAHHPVHRPHRADGQGHQHLLHAPEGVVRLALPRNDQDLQR